MANSNPLFTEVTEDGKLLKFADTQHFTGENNEGRARTGEKNPFPVAGYGMTESGIWVPNRVSDKGEQLTQVTGSNVEYDNPIPIVDINRNKEIVKTPLGFRWKNHFINNKIYFIPETKKFHTDFDMSEMKYVGNGKTYFVDITNGLNTNDGLSEDTPFQTVRTALEKPDVETVMIAGGLYNRRQSLMGYIEKSVNLISYNGKVKLSMHEDVSFNKHTLDNVYVGNRTNVNNVYDAKLTDDDGDYLPVKRVNSVEEVADTPNSYSIDGNDIYIRTYDDRPPDESVRVYLLYNNIIRGNVHVYLEGIEFEGSATVKINSTDGLNIPDVFMKDSSFKYSSANGLTVEGSNVFSQRVISSKNSDDGFNYHSKDGITCKAIEIDCSGKDNGREGDSTVNGSSMHDGGAIIRINGEHIRNYGPNIADVNDGTQSWNLGTIGFKSYAPPAQNSDFTTGGNVDVWLDNVVGYGSQKSLDARVNSNVYVRDCVFTNEDIEGEKYNY